MAETQTDLRLPDGVLAAARKTAKARGLDLNEYVQQLIVEDTDGVRARGMQAAQRIIDEFGADTDALEAERLGTGQAGMAA
jgi:hypothetical protein